MPVQRRRYHLGNGFCAAGRRRDGDDRGDVAVRALGRRALPGVGVRSLEDVQAEHPGVSREGSGDASNVRRDGGDALGSG